MEISNSTPQPGALSVLLGKLSFTPAGAAGVVLLALLPLIPPFNQEYLVRWLVQAALIAALAVAFDFTAGYISIVNFGFCAIMGLGAYTSALIVIKTGISPWLTIWIGACTAAAMGFFIGLITLRLRGIFAACLAWFLGLALMGLATKMVWLTRGPLGLRVPRLFDTASNIPFYYVILVMMVITYLITRLLVGTKMGLAFKAIGQNMEAARTSGINPMFYRIINFTISCALAGWLGGFYAHYYGILTPDMMHTAKTVEVLALAYIGGRGSLWGGAAVAFPFMLAMELVRSGLSNLPGLNLIIYGLMLMLIMIYYPGGFAQFYNTYIGRPKKHLIRKLNGGTADNA